KTKKDNRKLKFKAFSPLVFSFGKMRGLFSALSINSDWRKKEWHTTTDGRTGNGVSGKKRRKSCCVSAALMK
ncbi:hypothetical protein MKM55_10140, partial [Streptococcus suis]|nr:hypothetical protein [Streptococcus suis]